MGTQYRPIKSAENAKAPTRQTISDIFDQPYQEKAFDPSLAPAVGGTGGTIGQVWTADGANGADWQDAPGGVFAYNSFSGLYGENNNQANAAFGAVQIGLSANGSSLYGIAIGPYSTGGYDGIGIGKNTNGNYQGVAVGGGAQNIAGGAVSIGYGTRVSSGHSFSVVIGHNVQSTAANQVSFGTSVTDNIRFAQWTPVASGDVAGTHTLEVTISGATYKILLSNV